MQPLNKQDSREVTVYIAAFSFVVFSMNAKFLSEEKQYLLFVIAMFTYCLGATLIKLVKNWDKYFLRIVYGLFSLGILWGIKHVAFGNPYCTNNYEKLFAISLIASFLYLLTHGTKLK